MVRKGGRGVVRLEGELDADRRVELRQGEDSGRRMLGRDLDVAYAPSHGEVVTDAELEPTLPAHRRIEQGSLCPSAAHAR
jgi:glyoxylase-like metal-dependent hydrolase (beta-lactamase superfamily II)